MSLSDEELAMLRRVAAGAVGWANNHPHRPEQDYYFTVDGLFADWGASEVLRALERKFLITQAAPWVLVTDKGREALR